MKVETRSSEFRRGLVRAVPMMLGFIPFGLVLGAQAAHKGFSPAAIALLCALNFAGGSEFVAIDLWRFPVPTLAIVGATLLVNSRHILMGAALTSYMNRIPLPKALIALYFMCDETWALGIEDAQHRGEQAPDAGLSLWFYAGTCFCLYLTWVVSVSLGAAIGPVLGDTQRLGFDMAFPAVFLVLLRGMWKGIRPALPWLGSLIAAAVTHLLTPGVWYVVAGSAVGLVVAYLLADDE
jgi:4-azaleucine resistance transporter AzlC